LGVIRPREYYRSEILFGETAETFAEDFETPDTKTQRRWSIGRLELRCLTSRYFGPKSTIDGHPWFG
jgi:hypothetical protein